MEETGETEACLVWPTSMHLSGAGSCPTEIASLPQRPYSIDWQIGHGAGGTGNGTCTHTDTHTCTHNTSTHMDKCT